MALRRIYTLLALCALMLSTGCCCHRCWLHRRHCCAPCSSPCNSCCGYGPAVPAGPIAPIPAPPPPPPVAPLWQHP